MYLALHPDVAELALKFIPDLRIELRNCQWLLFFFVEKRL